MAGTFWRSLAIPESLITDLALPTTARYLYMVLAGHCSAGEHSCRITLKELKSVSHIKSGRTLRAHLVQLVARGWITENPSGRRPPTLVLPAGPHHGPQVAIPASLVQHPALSPAAKCLYATIVAHRPAGRDGWAVRQDRLAQAAGIKSCNTVRSLTEELYGAGWLRLVRGVKPRIYSYTPLDPHEAARQSVLDQVLRRLKRQDHKGEALMKEMLNVLIADDHFEDNARPGFLVNPLTGERLEFDRWYTKAKVAFEFNGTQHYAVTDAYPDAEQVRQQRARDLMKAAMARQQGIHLVTVHPGDLTFARLSRLAEGLLPVRRLVDDDPVVRTLNKLSRAYVRRARRAMALMS